MSVVRSIAIGCAVTAIAACAKSNDRATDTAGATAAAVAPAPPPPAAISLADIAGKWQVRSTPEPGTRDTSVTQFTLTTTADTTGWTMTYPGRKPVPMHVSTSGDSIMTTAGPYESFRRKGMQVRTQSVFRKQGDRLVGSTVAHYASKGADSVLHLRTEATRAP